MNKKHPSNLTSSSTSSLNSRKHSVQQIENTSSPEKSHKSNSSLINRKFNSAGRPNSDYFLTSIIEEKVSNLKTKFTELSGLRKKFAESTSEASPQPLESARPRIKSNDLTEGKKNSIFSGVIFQTDEKQYKNEFQIDSDKGNIEQYLSNKGSFISRPKKSSNFELENLKLKLKDKEKEILEIQKVKALQDTILAKKEEEIRNLEEKYRLVVDINGALEVQVSRLEGQMKNLDKNKLTNDNAVKNLSNIILSKDSPAKDLRPDQGILSKYIEVLSDLQNSDQIILTVLEKLKKNQPREAFRALINIENLVENRVKTNKVSLEQLESYNECRSPVLLRSESKVSSKEPQARDLQIVDFYSFIKCQAALIEDILYVN